MKTSTAIKGSVLLIGLALVVGYYLFNLSLRNKIQLENAGSVTWNKIELKAGGRIFKIDHLDAGAKKKFLFFCNARKTMKQAMFMRDTSK